MASLVGTSNVTEIKLVFEAGKIGKRKFEFIEQKSNLRPSSY